MVAPRPLDYDVLVEDWGRIILRSGIEIRCRSVLTHLGAVKENTADVRSTVQVDVRAPAKHRGEPGDGVFRAQDVTESIKDFEIERSAESIYRVRTGHLILIRYHPQLVLLTRRFNPQGEPVLGVQAQNEMVIVNTNAPGLPEPRT